MQAPPFSGPDNGRSQFKDCSNLTGSQRDLRMTLRYSQLPPEHLKEAVQNLDRTFSSRDVELTAHVNHNL